MQDWKELTRPKFWLNDFGGFLALLMLASPISGLLAVRFPEYMFLIAAIVAGIIVASRAIGWKLYCRRHEAERDG